MLENGLSNLIEVFLKALGIAQNPLACISMFGLIMARLVPAINYAPFLGGAVSGRIKIGIAFALSFILYPVMAATIPVEQIPTTFIPFVLLLVKEAIIGFTLSYITGLIFYGIQSAGQMIDNMRGATIAQLLSLEFGTQVSLIGQFKLQAAILLFFLINGHLLYIRGLFYSFEALPINTYPRAITPLVVGTQLTPLLNDLVKLSADVLLVSMQLAAPVIICLFLTDVIFGIFNRVAPQINVFFLSLPVKMMVACAMLFLLWAAIVTQMEERFSAYINEFYRFILEMRAGG